MGLLLVYDVTEESTFEHLNYWLNEVNKLATNTAIVMLLGNKCDLENKVFFFIFIFFIYLFIYLFIYFFFYLFIYLFIFFLLLLHIFKIFPFHPLHFIFSPPSPPPTSHTSFLFFFSFFSKKKVITTKKAQQFADSQNLQFIETSAKENQNVEEAFKALARAVKAKLIDGVEEDVRGKEEEVDVGKGKGEESKCCA